MSADSALYWQTTAEIARAECAELRAECAALRSELADYKLGAEVEAAEGDLARKHLCEVMTYAKYVYHHIGLEPRKHLKKVLREHCVYPPWRFES